MQARPDHIIRVATAQYFVRPIRDVQQFVEQVEAIAETAAGYRARLLVLPEYFTLQLIALHGEKRPIYEEVRYVAGYYDLYRDTLRRIARDNGLYIVGGTMPVQEGDVLYNDAHLFSPNGDVGVQGKLHMTRFEREEWYVSPRQGLKVFETDLGKLSIAICYDVEFPELIRAVAHEGVHLLAVPSTTDDRMGFLRVRYCAHARAIENQMYVLHSSTVGGLPRVPDMSLHYGQASILTPCDYPFARDGILAEGTANQEGLIVGELNLKSIEESRTFGTVLPLRDSRHTKELMANVTVESL